MEAPKKSRNGSLGSIYRGRLGELPDFKAELTNHWAFLGLLGIPKADAFVEANLLRRNSHVPLLVRAPSVCMYIYIYTYIYIYIYTHMCIIRHLCAMLFRVALVNIPSDVAGLVSTFVLLGLCRSTLRQRDSRATDLSCPAP